MSGSIPVRQMTTACHPHEWRIFVMMRVSHEGINADVKSGMVSWSASTDCEERIMIFSQKGPI